MSPVLNCRSLSTDPSAPTSTGAIDSITNAGVYDTPIVRPSCQSVPEFTRSSGSTRRSSHFAAVSTAGVKEYDSRRRCCYLWLNDSSPNLTR